MPKFERKYYHKAVYLSSYYFDYIELNWQIPVDFNAIYSKEIIHSHLFHLKDVIEKYTELLFSDSNTPYLEGLNINKSGQQLVFKFGGTFFRHTHYTKDWDFFYNLYTNIKGLLLQEWENDSDLARWSFPQFKISQIHISENLYRSKYKKSLAPEYVYPLTSKVVSDSMEKQKGGKLFFIPKKAESFSKFQSSYKSNKQIKKMQKLEIGDAITGYTVGTTGSAICTLYDKSIEGGRHKALERFGTDTFYRREFKVYRKKLNSWLQKRRTPEHMDKLIRPFKHSSNTIAESYNSYKLKEFSLENFSKLIRTIRVSVDILHENDPPKYTIFHEKYLTSIEQFHNWFKNKKQWKHTKHPILMTGMERRIKPSLLKETVFNPTKMVIGLLKPKNTENINSDEWRHIINAVTTGISKNNTFHVIDKDVIENEAVIELQRAVLKFNQAFK